MINYEEMMRQVIIINSVTNDLADRVQIVKNNMIGKGISPAEAPIVAAKLQQVENVLRQICANPDKLVPGDFKIHVALPR